MLLRYYLIIFIKNHKNTLNHLVFPFLRMYPKKYCKGQGEGNYLHKYVAIYILYYNETLKPKFLRIMVL